MNARDDGQLTLPGFGLMEITLACRKCRAIVQDRVDIGSSAQAVLKKFGWVSDDKGFLCGKCKGDFSGARKF